ncbi:beta-glucoside-specific PTS transporter subunit IIABC [Lacrimispora sp.]|uniref:beta-glucoside-specific PTS transporter subunit IIABC n=1 Tax=Lacrimispora sp. TaxID=2719234 RepID=UPI0028AF83A3|nr:beta-glucoside-specific PTS transporter subunit IIABC [Lacrimispora sp.]
MAKKNYDELAKQIITFVGGVENISELTHCVTRLRFKLIDNGKADQKALKALDGVLSVVIGNGQFQVVVGTVVEDIYNTILQRYPIKSEKGTETTSQKSGNVFSNALNMMSIIVNPIVIALAGAGMIKALLVILTTTLGVLNNTDSTYLILSAAGNSVFYFLPLFLAFSSAKAFNCNPYISVAMVGALMEPNFTGLMKNAGDVSSFIGIPVVLMKYSGTLIPAIIAVLVYSKLEKLLKKFIPKSIELFALSFAALIIMVPLSVIVIGPIGVYLANGIGDFVNLMSTQNGLVTGFIIGGGWTLLVMIGIHWGVAPIMINNISTYGYDYIRPMVAAATFGSAGAAFGVFLKAKKKETKAFALSAVIPALLGGVTEPIVYGISIKYKKPFIAQMIGGAVAGAFIGAMHTKAYVYVFPALTTLPAFFGDTFVYYAIGITLAFVVSAAITYILGIDESLDGINEDKIDVINDSKAVQKKEFSLGAFAEGNIVKLEDVNDEVFASKTMGEGVAISPDKGILYSPADGEIAVVFDTGHAIGMITDQGTEILMHIGINTVELKGKGFHVLTTVGESVKRGDVLVEFDLEEIKRAGYDTTTLLLLTNTSEAVDIDITSFGHITQNDNLINIRRK